MLLNLGDASLTIAGQKIELTKNEFKICQMFFESAGKFVTRDAIMTLSLIHISFGERDAARKNKYSKFLCANHSDEPLRTGIMFGNGLHDSCVSSPLHKHGIFHIYFFWRLCSSNG